MNSSLIRTCRQNDDARQVFTALRPPLVVTDRTAVLVLQLLRIRLHVQDLAKIDVGLGWTDLVGTCDCFEMRERRIQLRVCVELTHGLFLIGGDVEGGLQDERVGCGGWCHNFLMTTVATEKPEMR